MPENSEGLLDFGDIAGKSTRRIRRNYTTPMLYEEIIKSREGQIAHMGPLVVRTGSYTERSTEDRYIVKEPTCEQKVWWSGKNKAISEEHFNTRAAFPLPQLPDTVREGRCGHPRNAFFLTCDPYGVLPPIARLTPEQATFALLSSYTPELAEAEHEPALREARVLNSACFGASPLVLKPQEYAKLFMQKILRHNVRCWLMNTGWSGEPKGRGRRVELAHSRALVHAAIGGKLEDVDYELDPIFQYEIPKSCPGVPETILNPRSAAGDEGEYEVRANRLASDFMMDFIHFKDDMPESIQEMLSRIVLLEDTLDLMDQFRLTI